MYKSPKYFLGFYMNNIFAVYILSISFHGLQRDAQKGIAAEYLEGYKMMPNV